MSEVFQYNKTELQRIQSELAVRYRALPILRAKESALRLEVKILRKRVEEVRAIYEEQLREMHIIAGLWREFKNPLRLISTKISTKNVAGELIQKFESAEFEEIPYDVFSHPKWYPNGVEILKRVVRARLQLNLEEENLHTMERSSRKTTQKVNLYEKVQIPRYEQSILMIKRFLEDEDNLSRAAQKIMKRKNA